MEIIQSLQNKKTKKPREGRGGEVEKDEKIYIKNVKRKIKETICLNDEEVRAFLEYEARKKIRKEKVLCVCSWCSLFFASFSLIFTIARIVFKF